MQEKDNKILAAIDIGTNSFHIISAMVNEKGIIKILARDKEVVRLGKSSNDMKHLSEEAMQRGIATLKRFKLASDSFDAEIRAVATSAVREALNKDDFINRVYEMTGIKIEVVSGYEEARLIYLGVLQALDVYDKKILLIDIGGGSTEFLIGEKGQVKYANSIKVGAVRMTEKFFSEKKFSEEQVEEARLFVKSMINPAVRDIKTFDFNLAIGSSGTIINLGEMIYSEKSRNNAEQFNYNGFAFGPGELNSIVKRITRAGKVSNIVQIPGSDPERADIITAGSIILEQIFSELKLKEITLSNYALREGIILDTIDKEHNTLLREDLNDIRFKSIINLARNCNYDKDHSEQVVKFAMKIFDVVGKKFELTEKDKEYLEAASILHDTGHNISHSQHHRHSYYLIRNSDLLGFNDEEIEIIANLSRYHRKSHPKMKHENFNKLSAINKEKVRKLAGILRIADGLDRGHRAKADDIGISVEKSCLRITVHTKSGTDASLEIWGANMRKELFELSFGYKVEIEQSNLIQGQ